MPVTKTTQAPSFESVWALIKEVAENQKETDRINKDNALQMKELRKSQRETDRQIGSLTNLFGDFTVGMIVPKIREKFIELGLVFLKSSPNVEVTDKKNKIAFEIDILLENGDKAMLIEVKTKLTEERIKKHIKRLGKMRKYADIHGDKRTFLGAVAGFAITEEVRDIALKQGFYLIEPDGENFNIISPQGKPKEW